MHPRTQVPPVGMLPYQKLPQKRFDRAVVSFLTLAELDALAAAPDCTRWEGRRDYALSVVAVQTGLRVFRTHGTHCADVTLGFSAHVCCYREGRKERVAPITASITETLLVRTVERAGHPDGPDSRPAPAAGSAERLSSGVSPNTRRPRNDDVHRSSRSASLPTSCDTPPPCNSCLPAATYQ
jgi:integrase